MLDSPPRTELPLFVYGALKPGMPAYQLIHEFVNGTPEPDKLKGELFVRDGLPLLFVNEMSTVSGFVLHWRPGYETKAYQVVCEFEPRGHYKWKELPSILGRTTNALVVRHQHKGNPQPLHSSVWRLRDDPAFNEGLNAVRDMVGELTTNKSWNDWERFFRAQMAYLLLWSILERLSAFCFGPGRSPMDRINHLHELPGMADLVRQCVKRTDCVSDSRDPGTSYNLSAEECHECFKYYYQVRSNLSHRGKAVHNEVDKVVGSLSELIAITDQYLAQLRDRGQVARIRA